MEKKERIETVLSKYTFVAFDVMTTFSHTVTNEDLHLSRRKSIAVSFRLNTQHYQRQDISHHIRSFESRTGKTKNGREEGNGGE